MKEKTDQSNPVLRYKNIYVVWKKASFFRKKFQFLKKANIFERNSDFQIENFSKIVFFSCISVLLCHIIIDTSGGKCYSEKCENFTVKKAKNFSITCKNFILYRE